MSTMSNKASIHEKALNLARRWSVQNENDLMQEDIFEDSSQIGSPRYDRSTCQALASHLEHVSQLPTACMKYQDVATDLKHRDTDTTHASQILS